MLDTQSVAHPSQFFLSEADIERRKIIVDLTPEDISRIATLKEIVTQEGDRYTEDFFHYLRDLGEAPEQRLSA
jgi:rsbT co-antagonist protein RsbR